MRRRSRQSRPEGIAGPRKKGRTSGCSGRERRKGQCDTETGVRSPSHRQSDTSLLPLLSRPVAQVGGRTQRNDDLFLPGLRLGFSPLLSSTRRLVSLSSVVRRRNVSPGGTVSSRRSPSSVSHGREGIAEADTLCRSQRSFGPCTSVSDLRSAHHGRLVGSSGRTSGRESHVARAQDARRAFWRGSGYLRDTGTTRRVFTLGRAMERSRSDA